MSWRHAIALSLAAVVCAGGASAASGQTGTLNLAETALAEQVPSAFGPRSIQTTDFQALRVAGGDPSLHVWLEHGSLRWVRVGQVVVPLGVLKVAAPGGNGGTVRHAGKAHPLVFGPGGVTAAVPVALLSTAEASIEVEIARGAERTTTAYALRYSPAKSGPSEVHFDRSCSPYGLAQGSGAPPPDSWLYIGCRLVRTGRDGYTTATLELQVLWDHAEPDARIDGTAVAAATPALFLYRVGPAPGRVVLSARGHELVLRYRLPPVFHAGFLGAGVGPYYYRYEHGGKRLETPVALLTIYSGYAFNPSARVVYFSAAVPSYRGYVEQGLYYWSETVRFFDDRISMNVLLGGNLLIYKRGSETATRLSAPQGIEFIYRDFLSVGKNLTAGAFVYPYIAGSAYYNGWLRWGSGRFFGEANFLFWETPHSSGKTKTTTVGMTFGMPLLRFL